MRQECYYTELQPNALYQLINPSKADVIVNKFIGTEEVLIDDEKTQTVYKYEMNSFSVNPNEITADMVEANIEKYLDYEIKSVTSEERIAMLEAENKFLTDCIVELSEVIYNG